MSTKEFVMSTVAKAFGKDVSELSEDTNLLEDLDAKSTNYFPIMNALEEKYDLDIQYQAFRTNQRTIGDIIEMVESEI